LRVWSGGFGDYRNMSHLMHDKFGARTLRLERSTTRGAVVTGLLAGKTRQLRDDSSLYGIWMVQLPAAIVALTTGWR
jgi:hypothetical protein